MSGLSEAAYVAMLCGGFWGGEAEVRYDYGGSYNIIDCVTPNHAIEFGLDKASSRDSIVQAVIAANVLKREPVVFIIDQDGVLGKHEREIFFVCKRTRGVVCLVGNVTLEGNVVITHGEKLP